MACCPSIAPGSDRHFAARGSSGFRTRATGNTWANLRMALKHSRHCFPLLPIRGVLILPFSWRRKMSTSRQSTSRTQIRGRKSSRQRFSKRRFSGRGRANPIRLSSTMTPIKPSSSRRPDYRACLDRPPMPLLSHQPINARRSRGWPSRARRLFIRPTRITRKSLFVLFTLRLFPNSWSWCIRRKIVITTSTRAPCSIARN